MRPSVDELEKLEKIKEVEYDLDRFRGLVERVDERANGVMYLSGALAAVTIALLTFVMKNLEIAPESLITDYRFFVISLGVSSFLSMLALFFSIFSIYPKPFNVNASAKKDNRGIFKKEVPDDYLFSIEDGEFKKKIENDLNTILEILKKRFLEKGFPLSDEFRFQKEKKGRKFHFIYKNKWVITDKEMKFYIRKKKGKLDIYRDGIISFESRFSLEKPTYAKVKEMWQNMAMDQLLNLRIAVLHGQMLAVVRKYTRLRWALIFLTVSVLSLFISLLPLISKFIPGLVC